MVDLFSLIMLYFLDPLYSLQVHFVVFCVWRNNCPTPVPRLNRVEVMRIAYWWSLLDMRKLSIAGYSWSPMIWNGNELYRVAEILGGGPASLPSLLHEGEPQFCIFYRSFRELDRTTHFSLAFVPMSHRPGVHKWHRALNGARQQQPQRSFQASQEPGQRAALPKFTQLSTGKHMDYQ